MHEGPVTGAYVDYAARVSYRLQSVDSAPLAGDGRRARESLSGPLPLPARLRPHAALTRPDRAGRRGAVCGRACHRFSPSAATTVYGTVIERVAVFLEPVHRVEHPTEATIDAQTYAGTEVAILGTGTVAEG